MNRTENAHPNQPAPAPSEPKASPTCACSRCTDGIREGSPAWSPAYGLVPPFCDCETGVALRREWTQTPERRESLRRFRMERAERSLERSGVGRRFREKRLGDLRDNAGLHELALRYVEGWDEHRTQGRGLYFWGGVGRGKTHAAMSIANELVERHAVEVMFVNIPDIASRVRRSFDEAGSADRTLFEELAGTELLVLDDLGMEHRTDWVREQIYRVVEFRYRNQRPILVTSNRSPDELDHLPQVVSRLYEMCRIVEFGGSDRRLSLRPSI